MHMSLPNILTLLRMALIPVFVIVFYLPWVWAPLVSATVFTVAALTDLLDGYFARRLNQVSTHDFELVIGAARVLGETFEMNIAEVLETGGFNAAINI